MFLFHGPYIWLTIQGCHGIRAIMSLMNKSQLSIQSIVFILDVKPNVYLLLEFTVISMTMVTVQQNAFLLKERIKHK